MGCDIHMRVEVKRSINNETKWVDACYYKKNQYYNGQDKCEKEYEKVQLGTSERRNYHLFSILADVRNSGGIKPISQPKGIPSNACKETLEDYKEWGCDAHTLNWFTLKRLMSVAKNYKTIPVRGAISPKQKEELDEGIKPTTWCQWTSQEDHVEAHWADEFKCLDNLIADIKQRLNECLFYGYSNEVGLKEKAGDIRIIFWFDN